MAYLLNHLKFPNNEFYYFSLLIYFGLYYKNYGIPNISCI